MGIFQVEKQHTLTGHKDCLYTVTNYSDKEFISAGGDGMVVLWNLENPDVGQMIVKVPSSVYALSYSPERDLLVVGQNFNGIHLIDVKNKREVGSLALSTKAIFDIKTTKDAIFVATGAGEVHKVSWNLQEVARVTLGDKSARALALNSSNQELAVGSSDHYIRILDENTLESKVEFKAHDNSVFTLQYHPQLPVLISAGRDARIKIWDRDNHYQLVEEVVGHMYAINHISFSPSAAYFASCSMDKSVKIWDATAFKLLKVIDKARHAGHATSVNKLVWMNYQNWLVSCSDDRSISVWQVDPPH